MSRRRKKNYIENAKNQKLTNIISVTLQMRRITFLIFLKAFLCAFSLMYVCVCVYRDIFGVCYLSVRVYTYVVQFNPKLHYKVNGY